ncbi:MAG: NADH-quinone oxidoreductase subunit D [Synergistales bacterium]|nr:NADH-quinone oxidoreductase subunit D [Synergistales bacterium]
MTSDGTRIAVTETELSPCGEEGYDLYFGPAHAASGNFGVKLGIRGERVVRARADPGYLHRGFEKLMEYRAPIQNAVLSDRICVFESLNWNLLHAEAVEELLGVEVPERAMYIRVVMAELSRIQSHLIWYGAFSLALGFDTGFKMAFGYRDYILDLFEAITGGRVYPAGYICPGGVRRDFPPGMAERIEGVLQRLEEMVRLLETEYLTLLERTEGVGVLTPEAARRCGATGPVLRASGIARDVRDEEPYEVYDRLEFEVPSRPGGDAGARYRLAADEIRQSMSLVRQALAGLPGGEAVAPRFGKPNVTMKLPEGEVYVRNEVARGEGAMYMVGNGEPTPWRVKIKGPSFLHMIPLLEHLFTGAEIADIPAIYWSLNICPADMDR